jgi:hypothetical protein
MQRTVYNLSLFPPAFSYFWQFNPFIALFNPTVTVRLNDFCIPEIKEVSLTRKP